MSCGRKRILSLFIGRKKWKAWNKRREKYVPDERRQNLAETDKGSYYNQEGWLEEFLDDKGAFYNLLKLMIVIMMMTIIMKKYWRIRLQMFFKIGILKNVWKFHRKTPVLEFLFIKVCNFRLQHRYFPMKFANTSSVCFRK